MMAASMGTNPPDLSRLSPDQVSGLRDSLEGFRLLGVRDELVQKTLIQLMGGSSRRLTRVQLQDLSIDGEARSHRQNISARLGGELRLIAVEDIRYFLAEHKYVTVRYVEGSVLIEESLRSLEQEFENVFLRIHRNALVAMSAIVALEKDKSGGHKIKLRDIEETLEVSRRHLPNVRRVMKSL